MELCVWDKTLPYLTHQAYSIIFAAIQKMILGATSKIPIANMFPPITLTVRLFEALPYMNRIRPMPKHAKPKVAMTDKISFNQ
jgi:hypothetical protein